MNFRSVQQSDTNQEGSPVPHLGATKCIDNDTSKERPPSQLESLVQIPGISRSLVPKEGPRTTANIDTRRNLYVLGLPFDLTKTDFTRIFSPFGTVAHAVILATVDSSSRRRGFIVMSTHDEARAAMNGLSRRQIKGHTLDVSWAVVQRSQGFLDGGDRSPALTVTAPFSTPRSDVKSSEAPLNSYWTITSNPATKLLVSNLPTLLFTQVSDLQPLFHPFGSINKIAILQPSHNTLDSSITAVVEYADVTSAMEAKDSLRFQTYAGHLIDVHYVCDNLPPIDPVDTPLHRSSSNSVQLVEGYLDPFATHFLLNSRQSPANWHVQGHRLDPRYHTMPSNVLAVASVPRSVPIHLRPVVTEEMPGACSLTSSQYIASCPAACVDNSSIWRQAGSLCGGSRPPLPTPHHTNMPPLAALSHAYNIPLFR
ncbi:hypothetical protein SCLCIDRAFT_153879 [Scleroderma citrinum Foug A]|uniref:RRM domain-containing protein n=1 Tax=Scleroderma citrinum Foug A TaxID=1036808 RepID=A0A0C3A9X2_9AGAM|nr:hypothetical protein SCLCIDRAFT_153879 [Scleroderma citrinum Foug A]